MHENVAITFDSDNQNSYKRCRSRKRFLKYLHATTIREYFELGATLQDFRNDMFFGVFVFADPNLWSLDSNPTNLIQIRYFKIHEYQEHNFLKVKHIDGIENTADMFT